MVATDLLALYHELAAELSPDIERDLSEHGLPLDQSIEAAVLCAKAWGEVEECTTVPEQCFLEGMCLAVRWQRSRRGS